jgi:SMC interacting uncharacterized protein involved in chromosome segregation
MIYDGLSEEETVITQLKEVISLDNKNSLHKDDLMRILLSDLHELNSEVIKLQREVSKCNQRVAQLENKKRPYGKEVYTRVYSLLTLINDYGGSMTSTTVKRLMGLSKDEFYRTLRCAKDENQIDLTPNAKDRRSYIIKTKA